METFYTSKDLVEQGILSEEERVLYSLFVKKMDACHDLWEAQTIYLYHYDPKDILWLLACKPHMDAIMKRIESFLDSKKTTEGFHPDNNLVFQYESRWDCDWDGNLKLIMAWEVLKEFFENSK